MTGSKILKSLYILVLIGFVIFMFRQGKEGGELVYHHGLNVKAVKTLDDKVFDLEEALEEAQIITPVVEEVKPVEMQKQPFATSDITPTAETKIPDVETVSTSVQESAQVTDEVVVIPSSEELPTSE